MSSFEALISRLPGTWETYVSKGVRYLASELDSEEIKLKTYKNGVAIEIKTDDAGREKAKEFWRNHVMPELDKEAE